MKKLKVAGLLVAAVSLGASAVAQNPDTRPAPEFFRFDFSLKELEGGKLINARNYQLMAKADENAATSSIRSGGRVPIGGEKGVTYIDVGVNIDVRRVTHIKDELSLDVIAEVSGTIDGAEGQPRPQTGPPVVRQTRWNSLVLIPIRKPSVIFASDDPTSKRQMQLEVTATPIR